jgi:hypothetical protein
MSEPMIETTTLGGDTVLVSYREARRVQISLDKCAARTRELRRQWCEANGVTEDADPFAVFD